MKKSDFHYHLPQELIAQEPLPERSASRLLLVPPGGAPFEDRHVRDLPGLLRPGDLLVFNDTRVIPARLFGHKQSGGRVEILIERLLPDSHARAQIGASKAPRPGTVIVLERSTRSDEPTAPEGWDITDRRDYGETAVYYIEPAESAEPAEPVESAD